MKRRDFVKLAAGGAASVSFACAPFRAPSGEPAPVERGLDGYFHPSSEEEVIALVDFARRNGLKVRARGSGHSVTGAIYADDLQAEGRDGGIDILLDRMRELRFDDELRQVSVQAGCHLGMDPEDPTGTSRLEDGLFWRLNERGWALPDMGGIIHQTVAGFLSTGSAGGSLQHSIYGSIVMIRLVDGMGDVRVLRRPESPEAEPDDPFFAAGVSMGLLGVVTEVTFQCIEKYHVVGREVVKRLPGTPFDPFAEGSNGLRAYLRETEHARVLWWPQEGVEKWVVWEARRMGPDDYGAETGTKDDFQPRPYRFLEPILGSATFAQVFAHLVYEFFGPLNPPRPETDLGRFVNERLADMFPDVVNGYLKVTDDDQPRRFWDEWWRALPMDNEVDDDILPTVFTEAWIPIEHTRDVMVALRNHYEAGGFAATGTNACEIYAAQANPFWLSPAYQRDVVRIDLFWFAKNEGDPSQVYYPQFWDLLDRFEPRYHWGKHLPAKPDRLRRRYPKWDDFLAVRAEFDPQRVFLTRYWSERLGVA